MALRIDLGSTATSLINKVYTGGLNSMCFNAKICHITPEEFPIKK
jgi:hypothetical protein